jgi:hypothetical protein
MEDEIEDVVGLFDHYIKKPLLYVQYFGDGEVYISGCCGLLGTIDEVEDMIKENESEYFEKGEGDYYFKCTYNSEQTGEYGMVEVPAYWEADLVSFKPYDMTEAKMDDKHFGVCTV